MDKLELKEELEKADYKELFKQILQYLDEMESKINIYQQYAQMHGDSTYKQVEQRVRWYNE